MCVCVCVCARARACVCVCTPTLRKVSTDKRTLRFTNTSIFIVVAVADGDDIAAWRDASFNAA